MAIDGAHRMPWERRSEEPACDHARLQAYLSLGPKRSLAQAVDACGISLARLKQLSTRWAWQARVLAWDRHRFLERRGREIRERQQMRQRLLAETADWQRIARLEFGQWVRRDAAGQLQLTRSLTAHQAIRLWQVGCQAEMELRGGMAAGQENDSARHQDNLVRGIHQGASGAAGELISAGADSSHRSDLDDALRRVLVAWMLRYARLHPEIDLATTFWPWDLPFSQA
jgi:hypothetical protein